MKPIGKAVKVKLYIVAPLLSNAENVAGLYGELGSNGELGWDTAVHQTLIAHVSSPNCQNDELISLYGFDDDGFDSGSMQQEFIPSRDLGEKELEVGMKFGSAEDFRLALREIALKNKFDIKFTRNDGDRVSAVCKAECGWRIYASKPEYNNCLIIKTCVSKHTNCLWFHTNAQASSSYLATKYLEQLRINPKMPLSTLRTNIACDLNIDVSKHKVYKAKRKALELIEGNDAEQYEKMRDYCSLILRTNPGVIKLQTEPTGVENERRFQRVFIRYSAMKTGFKEGCRPLIGVDGCFLKGPYGGHLLSAVSNDGNGQIFQVTIAIVEAETRDSWEWFMGELIDVIGSYHGTTFISDRQKVQCYGISEAVDIENKSCSCRVWDVTGIPCRHAGACIFTKRNSPEAYVHPHYHRETYLKSYAGIILAIPMGRLMTTDPIHPLLPPYYRKPTSRPKKVGKWSQLKDMSIS
ncbi:uncharacterized protein LOC132272781 [Cornus florida]|uniref:uncharacterized protein LOC132272781 n=1 Tax=Cornus florida TaxID=4283 RepID=UPI0028A2352C|nr:uncharacterized protein LOC132272781 [Cornus florida]